MSNKREDWIDEVKANPLKYCEKRSHGYWPSQEKLVQAFECSESTARKLRAIMAPLVRVENARIEERSRVTETDKRVSAPS